MNLFDLYEMRDPRDAYERDVDNSRVGMNQQSRADVTGEEEPSGVFAVVIDGRPWKTGSSNEMFGIAERVANKYPDKKVAVKWPTGELNVIRPRGVTESDDYSAVTGAITRRIITQHPEVLAKYGPAIVSQAIDEIAEFVGDVDEIGSSDVSGWVSQVIRSLGRFAPVRDEGVAEGHTEVKDKEGKVVSWKDDSEWRRAEKNKQGQPKDPRGVVTHLSDVARRKTADQQGMAEGYYDLNDEGMQPIDLSTKPSFKQIVNRYTQLVYQGHAGETSPEEDQEYDEIEQYVARRFGEKGSAHLQKAGEVSYWGRDDKPYGRDSRGSNLGWPSMPVGNFRTTSKGKMHKQDAGSKKQIIGNRLGQHPAPALPEGEVDSDGYSVDHADSGEYDYEGDQARDQMNTIVRAARRLDGLLDDNENMPEWVQMKVTLAADYLDTAADYIESNQEPELDEGERGRGRPPSGEQDTTPVTPGRVEKTATGIRHHADASRYGGTEPDAEDDYLMSKSHISRLGKMTEPDIDEGEKVGNMDADKFDSAMARLKQLAGAGPMKTVYDPTKRVYRNVPVSVQPKK
jgi:hypothetical protein